MSPRPAVEPRLQRVLALLPYVYEHPGVTVGELAARFEVPVRELERDLELLPMCGLPPYTPDRLIEVDVDDGGGVSVRFAEYFERPLRLTPDEGLALLAAGRALLDVPGADRDGALASGLAKLAVVVGGTELDVALGPADEHLEALRQAADAGERVEIDYYSHGADALRTRRIDPRSVFHAAGHWYVDAFCHLAGGDRLFRVDRVRALRPTGERFTAEPPAEPPAVFHPGPDDPRVTLELEPAAAWVAEAHPTEACETTPDGRIRVVLAVSEPRWLERLLLRVGPDARVVDPPDLADLAGRAAGRLLDRYEAGGAAARAGRDGAAARTSTGGPHR